MSTPTADAPSIRDVMLKPDAFPVAGPRDLFKSVLDQMAQARLGVVCIVEDGKLLGVVTDGDIRRQLLTMQKPFSAFFSDDVAEHMTANPVAIRPDAPLREAVAVMEAKQVWDLPVVDEDGTLIGLLHLHPVVKALMGDG